MADSEYYDHTTYPSDGAHGDASAMRAELEAIAQIGVKLPVLTGNGGKIAAVNSGGTAIEAITTTGTGSGVRATSPALTTPNIGAATATSVNGLTVTSSTGTFTLTNGKTLTWSNTGTISGTDGFSLAVGTGGTLGTAAYTASTDYISSATIIAPDKGGTGIANNSASTITITGSYASTFTLTGTTGVTFPTTGTLSTLAGTEAFTNKTYNGNTWTAGTATLTGAAGKTLAWSNSLTLAGTDGKTLTVSNSITLAGTDSTVMTFPASSATVAGLGIAQSFSKAQTSTVSTLTDAATVAVDASLSNQYYLAIAGNRTFGVPTNVVRGHIFSTEIRQDTTGSRTLAYAWPYVWAGGTAATLTTAGCSLDQLVCEISQYGTSTVTITNAAPGVVSWTAHGFDNGQRIQLTTTGALPTGLTASTTYFIAGKTTNDFRLSTTLVNAAAGTYITTSSAGSGTHTAVVMTIKAALNKGWA